MRESNYKNIVVKVNPGGGRYLELLIHSIYDQDVLDELSIVELLKVLELADQFLCNQLIENGLEILGEKRIKTFAECNEILDQVQIFKFLTSVFLHKIHESITDLCASYLAEYFYSLECCPEKQNDFNTMPFVSISVLLESGLSFLHHENSVIYFLVTWLSIDGERQTEYNIKKLLNKVRYEYMTAAYFKDSLLIDQVLSKWSGFYQWCANALLYHGFSDGDKSLQGLNCVSKNRSISLTTQNFIIKLEHSEEFIFKQSELSGGNIIYKGYIFTPLITFVKNSSSSYDLDLNLYIGDTVIKKEIKFYIKFGIAVGVFASDITHKPHNMLNNKKFARAHFRRFTVQYIRSNVFKKNIGTIDEGLYQKFKTDGSNVSIIFGALEPKDWPANLKVLDAVKREEIHRTFNFDINEESYNKRYFPAVAVLKYF